MRTATTALCVACLCAFVPVARAGVDASSGAWTSFGGDAQIDSFTTAPGFTAKVKGFALAWSAQLDGGVTASPLAAPVAGKGLVVFAATENGNVYAVGPGGRVLWERSLGTIDANGNCGTYGIDSTATIDLARGLLYVVGATGSCTRSVSPTGATPTAGRSRSCAGGAPSSCGAACACSATSSTCRSPRIATRPAATASRRRAGSSGST